MSVGQVALPYSWIVFLGNSNSLSPLHAAKYGTAPIKQRLLALFNQCYIIINEPLKIHQFLVLHIIYRQMPIHHSCSLSLDYELATN